MVPPPEFEIESSSTGKRRVGVDNLFLGGSLDPIHGHDAESTKYRARASRHNPLHWQTRFRVMAMRQGWETKIAW